MTEETKENCRWQEMSDGSFVVPLTWLHESIKKLDERKVGMEKQMLLSYVPISSNFSLTKSFIQGVLYNQPFKLTLTEKWSTNRYSLRTLFRYLPVSEKHCVTVSADVKVKLAAE
jgi:hypothetical protein